jgi:hypothetical protein
MRTDSVFQDTIDVPKDIILMKMMKAADAYPIELLVILGM